MSECSHYFKAQTPWCYDNVALCLTSLTVYIAMPVSLESPHSPGHPWALVNLTQPIHSLHSILYDLGLGLWATPECSLLDYDTLATLAAWCCWYIIAIPNPHSHRRFQGSQWLGSCAGQPRKTGCFRATRWYCLCNWPFAATPNKLRDCSIYLLA